MGCCVDRYPEKPRTNCNRLNVAKPSCAVARSTERWKSSFANAKQKPLHLPRTKVWAKDGTAAREMKCERRELAKVRYARRAQRVDATL
jgi:hypothetical protein